MEDKATKEWLNSQKERTKRTYRTFMGYFQEFTGLTGDQIIEDRKADKEYTWEKKLLEFKEWIINTKKLSESTATTAANAIRGFFGYHRLPLEFRRSERAKIAETKPKYEDYRYSRDDLRKMCDHADLEEKYVVTGGKSFGLRAGDFLQITRGDLEPYIGREPPISIGQITTQKEKVPAFPLIDSDAKPIIELMIKKMDREGRTEPSEKMLTYKREMQLTRVIQRLTERAGINVGAKRVRFHCLRKFLIDRLASFMSESKWKQVVGKKIDEKAYVSPDLLRDDYKRAMIETCFTKEIPEGDIAKIAKKQIILELMKITEDEARQIFRAHGALGDIDKELEALEKVKGKQRFALRERNGGDCDERFEEINENDLLGYLREGWQVVHKLEKGKVIIRKG